MVCSRVHFISYIHIRYLHHYPPLVLSWGKSACGARSWVYICIYLWVRMHFLLVLALHISSQIHTFCPSKKMNQNKFIRYVGGVSEWVNKHKWLHYYTCKEKVECVKEFPSFFFMKIYIQFLCYFFSWNGIVFQVHHANKM